MPVCSSVCCALSAGASSKAKSRNEEKTFVNPSNAFGNKLEHAFFIVSSSWREKHTARVRAVDRRVTQSARLIFLRLIVEGRSSRRTNIRRQRVATEAQQVDLVLLEQPLIGRAVRRVTD